MIAAVNVVFVVALFGCVVAHEFGHALHSLLSDCKYQSTGGTSVYWDFVELPSQLYEHWLQVPEVLGRFAIHAETGAPMPKALLDKVLGAANHDMGFQTVEYLASALVDLAFHRGDAPADPMQRQAEVLDRIGMPHAITMRHATPHFGHVFSGDGYSSGYYSYMWSEVMDADACAVFEEAGDPFDAQTAEKLEAHILSVGGAEESRRIGERRLRGLGGRFGLGRFGSGSRSGSGVKALGRFRSRPIVAVV